MSDSSPPLPSQDGPEALDAFIGKWRARWPEWSVAEVFVPSPDRSVALAWASLQQELDGLDGRSDELHRISALLIERETIDKEQFERLLAGESEESVFPEEEPALPEPEPEAEEERKPKLKPQPRPIPGTAMQPPPPEGAPS